MSRYDVMILGAGAAGLFAARALRSVRTAVVDHNAAPGRKLAIAGGGMGNVTNRTLAEDRYVGDTGILKNLLRRHDCAAMLSVLESFGIPYEEREFGQIFCLVRASALAEALREASGADLFLGTAIKACFYTAVSGQAPGRPQEGPADGAGPVFEYHVRLANGDEIHAPNMIVATGSCACPRVGASGFGLALAARWGHAVVPFSPVLVPFVMPPGWPLSGLEGISLPARVIVRRPDGTQFRDPEGVRSLLVTHRGLSGPAALVASCFWRPGDVLSIDFLPDFPLAELLDAPGSGKKTLKTCVASRLPERLAAALLPEDLKERKAAELSRRDRLRAAGSVHDFEAVPAGTEGFGKAEAAAGGVLLSGLDTAFQSRAFPGLYFCGEVVNITGLLGGYNIHFAFASAECAAARILRSFGR
ncbi:MAG: NAD(P)/FAD-dependent oxidoreductase [Mailhella sp.]|nr:NAD(P)/FAD-dependent oxidoreductase [Mailhella sp.]